MTEHDANSSDPTLREQLTSTGAFLRRALRFWHAPVLMLLVGALGFGLFLWLVPPKYRSETVILYVERGHTGQDPESSDQQRAVSVRLRELLFARPNLERIANRFGLYPELRQKYGVVDTIEELKKHIDFRAPGGDTFSLAFEASSPKQAQEVTSELARLVIDGDAELRKRQAKVALDFLVSERQTRGAELRAAEEQLASFMAQHPRFALDATPLANGAAIRASMGASPTVAAPARPQVWQPRPAGAGGLAPTAPTPATAGAGAPQAAAKAADPEEARARAALAAARESLTEKLVHYTPAHPDVRAAEAEVQRATERLAALSSAAPPSAPASSGQAPSAAPPSSAPALPAWARAPARAAAAPPVAAAAPNANANANANAETLVELETSWLKLTRAVTEARQRQDQLEAQLFRADITASSASGGHGVQVSVIDPAFLPQRPQPPGRTTIAVIFAAASLVLGSLLALALAAFDDRLFTARDASSVAEVLVQVPRLGRRAHVS